MRDVGGGGGDVVGKVTHTIRQNKQPRGSWWRALQHDHPWGPISEVYMQVDEEEVSVTLTGASWELGGDDVQSPENSDSETEQGEEDVPSQGGLPAGRRGGGGR